MADLVRYIHLLFLLFLDLRVRVLAFSLNFSNFGKIRRKGLGEKGWLGNGNGWMAVRGPGSWPKLGQGAGEALPRREA
jgi:hypothetical protein